MKRQSLKICLILFCLISIINSCKTKQKEELADETRTQGFQTFNIDVDRNTKIVDVIKLSDIADSVEYIPLDTTNSVLIAKIQGLHVSDSLILIRDKGATYLLNSKGQFQKSLYHIGKGPREAYGTHVGIDNRNIYVANRWSKGIMRFSSKGEFLDEMKYKHLFWQFYFLKDMVVFPEDINPTNFSFYVHNRTTDSVIYEHPFRYSHLPYSRGGYSNMYVWFDIFEDNLLFKEQVCDTIFSTTDFNNIREAYILDFGSRRLKPEDYFSKSPHKFDNKQFITAFKEKSKFLLMKGVDNNELCQYLFNKGNKQILKSFDLQIKNDLDGGPSLHFWEIHNSSYDSRILYFYIQPHELLDEANKPSVNSKLDQIRKSTNINNNPILVKAYLKQP